MKNLIRLLVLALLASAFCADAPAQSPTPALCNESQRFDLYLRFYQRRSGNDSEKAAAYFYARRYLSRYGSCVDARTIIVRRFVREYLAAQRPQQPQSQPHPEPQPEPQPEPPEQPADATQPQQDQPPAASVRKVLPDGTVEIRYPDGAILTISERGKFLTLPDGRQIGQINAEAQPPTPPSLPSDPVARNWLTVHNESLLHSIRVLVSFDQPSVDNYLRKEQGMSVYQQINSRSRLIRFLLSNR